MGMFVMLSSLVSEANCNFRVRSKSTQLLQEAERETTTMGRSKQNKSGKKEGDRYRKETKEERRERLRLQAESREKCLKILPYAVGVIVFFLVLFAMWIRSVPPKVPKAPPVENTINLQQQAERPEFMNINTEPKVKEASDENVESTQQAEGIEQEATPPEEAAAGRANPDETIEL
eukprot:scaffold4095_cov117-Cylindrotheca_fusiformis.AAC.13